MVGHTLTPGSVRNGIWSVSFQCSNRSSTLQITTYGTNPQTRDWTTI